MTLKPVCGFLDSSGKFWNSKEQYETVTRTVNLRYAIKETIDARARYSWSGERIWQEDQYNKLSLSTLEAIAKDLKLCV